MNKPLDAIPIEGTLIKRTTGDPFELDQGGALQRVGNIKIRLGYDRKDFEIELLGNEFFDLYRPLIELPKAIIELNEFAVFDAVQECRENWQVAANRFKRQDSDDPQHKEHSVYELEWDNPLDEQSFRAVAGQLAVAGAHLFEALFGREGRLGDVVRRIRRVLLSAERVLTIIAPEFHIPWRMLYTHPTIHERLAPDGSNFDPRGFWGYQHIIEEFTHEYSIENHVVASGKLGFAATLHENIDRELHVRCIARHHDFVQSSSDRIAYSEWTNKQDVEVGLSGTPFKHQVVYFLCHAEVAGTRRQPSMVSSELKLKEGSISANDVIRWTNHKFGGRGPFVFINACQGGQLDTLLYRNHTFASELLKSGVVCLIAPQIEVPAVFAGEFGKLFFEKFIADNTPAPIAGEILRGLTREMWAHRNPFGLVYSLYARADCHIRWDKENK